MIRNFGEDAQKVVEIDGRTIDVDSLRDRLRSSLFQDTLIGNKAGKIQIYLKGKTLKVNGRKASVEQARRYAGLIGAFGIDTSGAVSIKLHPDSTEFVLSGSAGRRVVTVGRHTSDQ